MQVIKKSILKVITGMGFVQIVSLYNTSHSHGPWIFGCIRT